MDCEPVCDDPPAPDDVSDAYLAGALSSDEYFLHFKIQNDFLTVFARYLSFDYPAIVTMVTSGSELFDSQITLAALKCKTNRDLTRAVQALP